MYTVCVIGNTHKCVEHFIVSDQDCGASYHTRVHNSSVIYEVPQTTRCDALSCCCGFTVIILCIIAN